MKLMIAIIRDPDCDAVIQALTGDNFRVTRIASTGGFLRRGTATLLIGLEEDRVNTAIALIRRTIAPGGEEKNATVFVVPVDSYQQI